MRKNFRWNTCCLSVLCFPRRINSTLWLSLCNCSTPALVGYTYLGHDSQKGQVIQKCWRKIASYFTVYEVFVLSTSIIQVLLIVGTTTTTEAFLLQKRQLRLSSPAPLPHMASNPSLALQQQSLGLHGCFLCAGCFICIWLVGFLWNAPSPQHCVGWSRRTQKSCICCW